MQLLNFRKYSFLFVLLLSATFTIVACGGDDDDEGECNTENLTYDNFAQDFLITNCSTLGACHVEANKDVPKVGSFENYEDTKVVVDSMRIIGAINHEAGFFTMPKGGEKLDDCSIDKLTAWIQAGAPE